MGQREVLGKIILWNQKEVEMLSWFRHFAKGNNNRRKDAQQYCV